MRNIKFISSLCVTCHSCENACAVKHSVANNIAEIVAGGLKPVPRILIVERKGKAWMIKCRFCKKPKCVEACETGAIVKHEDGYVSIDEEKCNGCGACVEACPFDAIYLDGREKSVKCDLCLDLDIPACVYQCSVGALLVE